MLWGNHEYKDRCTSVKSEMLKVIVEPENKKDKFAVAIVKNDSLVGRLPTEKNGKVCKNDYLLSSSL